LAPPDGHSHVRHATIVTAFIDYIIAAFAASTLSSPNINITTCRADKINS
jgi:hypothetical protein